MTLTVKQVEAAKFGLSQERLSDGNDLYLRLYPLGKKGFQVQIAVTEGQRRRVWINLSDFPKVSLRQARDTAVWVRMQASRG
ncbi:DUF4102 domain-containing protein [Paracoccus sp. 11-3]|uniref:DUF4102 domain-containing protein n=1 Tax=Paracoccus amoyensis TaxID=2760093 RepID=A0A926JDE5_9RHOB|nr:Arm DNA-binding domain-containing protein [Paracoccus amoyensis]MBC9246863.1 DUF4102 domain-containing protein [Paracoccus amoyensis]